jgi:hypothetical protein
VTDKSVHQYVGSRSLHIAKADVIAVNRANVCNRCDIAQTGFTLLGEASRNLGVSASVTDANQLLSKHSEQHAIDFGPIRRLSLHKTVMT